MWSMSLVEDLNLLEIAQPEEEFHDKNPRCCTGNNVARSTLKRTKRVADLASLEEDSCDKDDSESDESSTRVRNRSGDLGAFGSFCKLRRILDVELEYFHRDIDITVVPPTRSC